MNNTVRCEFEIKGDEGYTRALLNLHISLLPKIGEIFYLYYPDGAMYTKVKVESIDKYISSDVCHLKFTCS